MENVIFFARNDEHAKLIAINDFVNKASKVLDAYQDILNTWIDQTPHTLFYSCYESMFSGSGSRFLHEEEIKHIDTISDTKSELFKRVKSFIDTEKDMRAMMGGGEYPFIALYKVSENMYQYRITR